MRKYLTYLLLFLSLFCIASCKPAGKVVQALTSAILEPVTVTITNGPDLGELGLSTEPELIKIEITNNSSNPIRKLNLNINKKDVLLKFTKNLDLKNITPGYGGTCEETLSPYSKCTYTLSFLPRKIGNYSIPVVFNYENLIEPQSKTVTFTALVGEPAALIFTHTSNFNFSIIEQRYPIRKTQVLEIQNAGGLSARNIQYVLNNYNSPGAYDLKVEENHCPTEKLAGGMKCQLIIGYTPHNNGLNDAEVVYTGKLSATYKKDKKNSDTLNARFTFKSATIEAKFKENFSSLDFGKDIITGNKVVKIQNIINIGYKAGTITELRYFKSSDNSFLAKCVHPSSGNILNCQDQNGLSLSMEQFPFKIEDIKSCVSTESSPKLLEAGVNCSFQITYWPSTKYTSATATLFKNLVMRTGLRHNSRLLINGKEERWISYLKDKTTDSEGYFLFENKSSFLAKGQLVIDTITVDDVPIAANLANITNTSIYKGDLGEFTLLTAQGALVYSSVLITYKNIGETNITFNAMEDLAGHQIKDSSNATAFNTDNSSGAEFYSEVQTTCNSSLAIAGSCTLKFGLTPIGQSNTVNGLTAIDKENAKMFESIDSILSAQSYKSFIARYTDGSSFEDDNTAVTSRFLDLRLAAKLLRKGKLIIATLDADADFGTLVNGSSVSKSIILKNIGTDKVQDIAYYDSTFNLTSTATNWPFTIFTDTTNNCLTIINNHTSLLSNESCQLGITSKMPEAQSGRNTAPSNELNRGFVTSILNSTTNDELWTRIASAQVTGKLKFKYYDSLAPVGTMNSTKEVSIKTAFQAPAYCVPKTPLPRTSAFIYRPAFSYPNYATDISNNNQSAKTFDMAYFDGIAGPFSRRDTADIGSATTDFTGITAGSSDQFGISGGTFPTNQTNTFQFTFTNIGEAVPDVTKTELIKDDENNNLKIQTPAALNFPLILIFTFNPTVAGEYRSCYTLKYEAMYASIQHIQKFCVQANAIADAPTISVSYFDHAVQGINNDGTFIKKNGTETTFANSPLNSVNTSSSISLATTNGSTSYYALKRIRLKNLSKSNLTKLAIAVIDATSPMVPLVSTSLPAGFEMAFVGSNQCNSKDTTLVGINATTGENYCEFDIQYKKSNGIDDLSIPVTIGLAYEIATGQKVYQTIAVSLDPTNPAVLAADPLPQINGVKNLSATDMPKSYKQDVGAYILTSDPNEYKEFTIPITNTSTGIRASFLNLNSSPALDYNDEIFNDANTSIVANKYCFYSDGIASDATFGFLSSNTGSNSCEIKIKTKGYKTYNCVHNTFIFGQTIADGCNPFTYSLNYYDSATKSISQTPMYIHLSGFIQPNNSIYTGTISNVTSENEEGHGKVSFTFPVLTPQNTFWGPVKKYRIYYSLNNNDFKDTNKTNYFDLDSSISYKETVGTENNVSISNLTPGYYYFFKVVAVREYEGLDYISNSSIPILSLPIPGEDEIYNDSNKWLIDKNYKVTKGSRATGIKTCDNDSYIYQKDDAQVIMRKSLINTSVFNYLDNNPAFSNYDIGSVPHWLSDNSYNISQSISLYNGSSLPGFPDYDYNATTATDENSGVKYLKNCDDQSCNNLYKLVGGPEGDRDLIYRGAYYTSDDGMDGQYRCFAVMP